MKRFLKFIPVALAAVALASCSNDDVLNIGGEEIVKDPSKLYVTVDPLKNGMGDITRSGFVIGTNDNGNPLANYFVWTEGDKVKLYDNENNWRPQIWEFDAAATKQYKKVEGFSVFTQNITEEELPIKQVGTSVAEQYKNAYGLYPYDLGEFTNETRTKLSFDLGELAFYELEKADETSVYADGQLAKAPIPLWGVATAGEMNVKYMTGILFVDISNLPAAAANKSKYLIIQSVGKTSGKGIKLHGVFDGDIASGNQAQVDYDPELLGDDTKAPVLKTTNTGAAATTLTALTKANAAAGAYADLIIIDLARAGGRTRVAVPIPVADEVQQISAYYTADQTNSGTDISTAAPTQIGGTIEKDVKSGSYYLIQNAGAETISDANTPYQLAQRIKEIDATMDRDYTITISADVNVDDTGADEHGFVLDLGDYSLTHNANIVFAAGKGFKGKSDAANTLTIRTGASDKTMTLTVAEAASAALKAIKVESDEKLAGKVVLKGTLHTIEANSQNLTVGAAATTVNASTTVNIDAKDETITTLNLYKGANQVNVLNGTITSINYTPANTAANKAKNVTGTVNVYSEGISGFKAPTATAAAVNGTVTFNFTSKLTAKPSDITTSFTTENAASIVAVGGYKEIYTAAQLAAIAGNAGPYVIKASEIDLNGSEIAWEPKDLSVAFDGNINANVTGDPAPAVVPAVIKNMKVAATTAGTPYGLFGTVTGAATAYNIQNLKIQDATIEGATGIVITDAGLLAGKITANSDDNDGVNINNITVTGTNKVETADETASANLGGLIGSVDHASKIAKVVLTDVNISGIDLKGYKNLGGVIGLVGKFANVKFAASGAGTTASPYKYNSASDITFTSNIISDQTSQDYATRGNFIGSATPDAANNAVIEIEVASHPSIGATAYTREFDMGEWNIMNKTTYANVSYTIVLRQNYIGFAGVGSSDTPDYHTPALVGSTWGVKFTTKGTSGSTKTYIPQITKYVASTDATKLILFTIEK